MSILAQIPVIADSLTGLTDSAATVATVDTVTSAAPLGADLLDRVKKVVEDHLHGASMEFRTDTDPALIGGFTVSIDNERLDASVERQLKELRQSLLK